MWDQGFVMRLKSFVAKRTVRPTPEECEAWEEFYLVIEPIIQSCIRRFHKAWDIIEDLSQITLLRVIRGLRRLRSDTDRTGLERWVASIATREALRFLRRKSRPSAGTLGSDVASELADPEPGPDEEFERMQEHELFCTLVAEFCESLCQWKRPIVLLYWVEARPLVDIARRLNMSEDAVWCVLRRTKPGLVDHLRRRGIGG